MARFGAPSRNGEVLAEPSFDSIPALVAANRRKLDHDATDRIAELTQHDQPAIGKDRQHQHRARMNDVFARAQLAVRQPHGIAAHVEKGMACGNA